MKKVDLDKEPLTMTREEIEDKYGKKYGPKWDKIKKEMAELDEYVDSMVSQVEELDEKQKNNQEKYEKIELMQNYYHDEKYAEAFEMATELIEMEVSFAKVLMGALYMHGQHVKKNTIKGLNIWTEAAEEGVPIAQFNLGILYINGGVEKIPKDVDKSIKFLEMAADNDHPEACFTLGQIYSDGKHVETNDDLSWAFMSKAKDLGNEDAINWFKAMEEYLNSMKLTLKITESSEKPQKKLTKLEKFFKDGKVLKEHYETCKNKILSESND